MTFSLPGLTLPKPTRSGNTLTFADVATDTDLRVVVEPDAIAVDLVLRSAAAAPQLTVHVSDPDHLLGKLSAAKDGSVNSTHPLVPGAGVGFAPPVAYQAGDDPSAASSSSASQSVSPRGDGFDVIDSVNRSWLKQQSFPVVLDPTVTFSSGVTNCSIQGYATGNNAGSGTCTGGPYSVGSTGRGYPLTVVRDLLGFDVSSIPSSAQVLSASLSMYATSASAGLAIQAHSLTTGFASSYNSPNWMYATNNRRWNDEGGDFQAAAATTTVGPSSGTYTWPLTSMVQSWVSGANYGLLLNAANESTGTTVSFGSSTGTAGQRPSLSVTYSIPPTGSGPTVTPSPRANGYVTSLTPTLTVKTSDTAGDTVRLDAQVYSGATMIASGNSNYVAAGAQAAWTVPAGVLSDGASYAFKWRVESSTGGTSAWSNNSPGFSIDATPPATPTVTVPGYPASDWSSPPTWTTPTMSDSSSDVDPSSWQINYDGAGWTANQTVNASVGWHDLQVRVSDTAGNLATGDYQFGVGSGGFLHPSSNELVVQRQLRLQATAPGSGGSESVRYDYRPIGTSTWNPVPTDALSPSATWPQTMTSQNGSWVAPLTTWTISRDVTTDGIYQLRACFTVAAVCSPAQTFTLDHTGQSTGAATTTVGPGTLSLLTGSYVVQAADASITSGLANITMSRTFNTANPNANPDGPLGPGWSDDLPNTLTDTGGFVTIDNGGGDKSMFTYDSSSKTYTAVGEAAVQGLKLAPGDSQNPGAYVVTDLAGGKTSYSQRIDGGSGAPTYAAPARYVVAQAQWPGTAALTYLYSQANGSGIRYGAPASAQWPLYAYAPVAQNEAQGCGYPGYWSWTAGCRGLLYNYGTVSTGSGQVSRLLRLSLVTGDSSNSARLTDIADYAYNSAGQLASVTDPRTSLATSYTYDANGRIATLAPPGQAAWNFGYDSAGRLTSVARSHNAANGGGTATTTIVYGVPLSGSGLPDLTVGTVAHWLQTDTPTDATAIFPPMHTPANPDAPTADEWAWAGITYMDADGRAVNTASYGGTADPDTGAARSAAWQITTTEYDPNGLPNVLRTLSADNRNRALAQDPSGTTGLADTLDTENTYASKGIDLLATYGPAHSIAKADGTTVVGRAHTVNTYDSGHDGVEGGVSGGYSMHLLRSTTSALSVGSSIPGSSEIEDRLTNYNYDLYSINNAYWPDGWTSRQPVQVQVDPNGLNLRTDTIYSHTGGLALDTTLPAGAVNPSCNRVFYGDSCDAHTTQTIYYDVNPNTQDPPDPNQPTDPDCENHPEYYGLVCKIEPEGQPTTVGLPGIPVTWYKSYNIYDEPMQEVETVTNASGGTDTRTTSTSYDTAGRVTSTSLTSTVGAAMPDVTTSYDPATGLVASASSSAGTITNGYDDWGQLTRYTDASGDVTTTAYDLQGRPTTITGTHGTTTYSYDQNGQHTGAATTITDSGLTAGSFTGSYDADGNLITETYPGGVTATWHYDATAKAVHLDYAKSGVSWMTFDQGDNAFGQVVTNSGPISHQLYSYDAAGRLTQTQDTLTAGPGTLGCTTRQYGYDLDSNRTTLTTIPPAGDGSCTTTGGTTVNHSYDAADRITDPSYSYDSFGRITAVPASDATGSGALSSSYFSDDMVRTETQGSQTKTWSLDPSGRLYQVADTTTGHTKTNYYADSSDSPSWTNNGDGSWSRNITDLAGDLAAIQGSSGTPQLQLENLHGDIVATTDATTAANSTNSYSEATEFGIPRSGTSATYGWLGAKRRSSDTLGGLILMGQRLYEPSSGRFLSVDPVAGGSANNYDYCNQDPINGLDLTGTQHVIYRHDEVLSRKEVKKEISALKADSWVNTILKMGSLFLPPGADILGDLTFGEMRTWDHKMIAAYSASIQDSNVTEVHVFGALYINHWYWPEPHLNIVLEPVGAGFCIEPIAVHVF